MFNLISKQSNVLNAIADDTSRALKDGNAHLSNAQAKLSDSLAKGNESLSEAQKTLSESLAAITKQLEAERKASLVRQTEFLGRLDASNSKAEQIQGLLAHYVEDEWKSQYRVSHINSVRNAIASFLQAVPLLPQGVSNAEAKRNLQIIQSVIDLYLMDAEIEYRTDAPEGAITIPDHQKLLDSIIQSIPNDNKPLADNTRTLVTSMIKQAEMLVQVKCDLAIMQMYWRHEEEITTATQPATTEPGSRPAATEQRVP